MFKKSILTITAATILTGAVFTSCNSSAEKVENAEKNVKEANEKLDKANEEYLVDMENYRQNTANKIAANEQSLIDFKLRIAEQKKEARVDYELKIAELEAKNTDMKKRMEDYKASGKSNWDKFKTDFSQEMEELGDKLRDLGSKND